MNIRYWIAKGIVMLAQFLLKTGMPTLRTYLMDRYPTLSSTKLGGVAWHIVNVLLTKLAEEKDCQPTSPTDGWKPNTLYREGEMISSSNGIFESIREHMSGSYMDGTFWKPVTVETQYDPDKVFTEVNEAAADDLCTLLKQATKVGEDPVEETPVVEAKPKRVYRTKVKASDVAPLDGISHRDVVDIVDKLSISLFKISDWVEVNGRSFVMFKFGSFKENKSGKFIFHNKLKQHPTTMDEVTEMSNAAVKELAKTQVDALDEMGIDPYCLIYSILALFMVSEQTHTKIEDTDKTISVVGGHNTYGQMVSRLYIK